MNQNITLTLGTFSVPETVHGVLKDTGRNLVIKLTDYQLQAGDSAKLYIYRPDEVSAEATGTINTTAQTVTVELDNAFQVVGPNRCTLTITSNGDTISSFEFEVACHPSAKYGGGITTGSFIVYAFGEEISYEFDLGMTWAQFIESAYSQDMFSEMGDEVYYDGGNLRDMGGYNVASYSTIQDGATYQRDET